MEKSDNMKEIDINEFPDILISMLNLKGKNIDEIMAKDNEIDQKRLLEIAKELQGNNSVDGLPSDFVEITDEAIEIARAEAAQKGRRK